MEVSYGRQEKRHNAEPSRPRKTNPPTASSTVIIETPKGSRNKFKWDPAEVLPARKSTARRSHVPLRFRPTSPTPASPDGDPIDVMLLMDEPAFPVLPHPVPLDRVIKRSKPKTPAKPCGTIRLLAVASDAHNYRARAQLSDVNKNLIDDSAISSNRINAMRGTHFKSPRPRRPRRSEKAVPPIHAKNRKP